MNIITYSPFEPTKVTYFENLELYIFSTQFLTTNIVCVLLLLFYLAIHVYFLQNLTLDSLFIRTLVEIYKFVYEISYEYLHKQINYYFAFLLYIFWVILASNLIGMIPLAFSITSHLSSTLSCAIFIWLSVITVGLSKYGLLFFKIILPKGIPSKLVPFLVFVEFISYIFRVVSLSLRLFANVLAGHILLHVVSGFIFFFLASTTYGVTVLTLSTSILLMIFLCILFFFELMVAMLQSYIFLVLSLIYLQDIDNLAH